MAMTSTERSRRAREHATRTGPPECGTVAGYRYHKNHDEPVDDACREAWNEYHRTYRATNK